MKKYYSPIKDYTKIKKVYPLYKIILNTVKLFFPKTELVWTNANKDSSTPKIFVCNHTKLYAPIFFLLQKPKVRLWGNYYFLYCRSIWQHMIKKVLKALKFKWLLYPIAIIFMPLFVYIFRAVEPIPVYHFSNKVIAETFGKSIETAESGINQVIFPERTENKVNNYVYQFNRGFPLVAQQYYKKTGKLMGFYPTYCSPALKKVLIGEPIFYNPDIPMKKQREDICTYLEDQIKLLGDSLPEHKPVLYVDKEQK